MRSQGFARISGIHEIYECLHKIFDPTHRSSALSDSKCERKVKSLRTHLTKSVQHASFNIRFTGTWNLLSAAKTALKLFLNSDIPIKPADHSYRSAVTLWSPALRMQPGVFNGPVTLITIILKTAVTARSSSNNFPCMLSGAERLKMCYRRIQVVWRRSEILSQLSGSSFKDFFDRLSSILFSSNGKWVGQSWFRSPRMI